MSALSEFKISVNLPFNTTCCGPVMDGVMSYIELLSPSLNQLDPTGSIQFKLLRRGTTYTAIGSTSAAQAALLDDGAHALVTDFSSAHTIPAVLAGARYNAWTCSGSSTSVQLNDKENYPKFFRAIAPDDVQGAILAKFISHMGWSTICVLAASEAYGLSVSTSLIANAAKYNLSIVSNQVFEETRSDFSTLLQNVVQSESNIIVVLGSPEIFVPLMREARKLGLFSDSYVWLGSEAWSYYNLIAGLTDEDIENVNGFLYVMPLEDSFTAEYNASVAKWNAAYPGQVLPSYSHFFQDCVTALARGLLKLSSRLGVSTVLSRNYTASLGEFTTSFDGVSGAVAFDALGNRISYFSVYNYYRNASTMVYAIGPDLSIQPRSPVRFHSGTSVVPRDRLVKRPLFLDWHLPAAQALVALDAVAGVAIVLGTGYLYRYRGVPDVRNLSFPFLAMISFGCVLVLASNVVGVGTPSTASCLLGEWAFTLGFNLVITAAAAKAYRIWRLLSTRKITPSGSYANRTLYRGVALISLLQSLLLAIWTGAYPFGPSVISTRAYFHYRCTSASPTFYTILMVINFGFNGLLVCALVALGYKTRHAVQKFRESVFLLAVGQNILISSLVVAPFAFFDFGGSTLEAAYIKHAVVIYGVVFAYVALAGRLVPAVVKAQSGGRKRVGDGGYTVSELRAPQNANANGTKTQVNSRAAGGGGGKPAVVASSFSVDDDGDGDHGGGGKGGGGGMPRRDRDHDHDGGGGGQGVTPSMLLLSQEDVTGVQSTVIEGVFTVRFPSPSSLTPHPAAARYAVELDTVKRRVIFLPADPAPPSPLHHGSVVRLVPPVSLKAAPDGRAECVAVELPDGRGRYEIGFRSVAEAEQCVESRGSGV
ncbi:hypothetical protein H9P43_008672 [Blastocladiella emersonii ATCC 22665]|nr:hypothetical protein H9P43_008672 [Blastocladiella emersonii ATCC 22665]